jgi:hypothetical protein
MLPFQILNLKCAGLTISEQKTTFDYWKTYENQFCQREYLPFHVDVLRDINTYATLKN